ncbi:hypothetical protein K402DRAFT_419435 [Aulographum hederae CBS 113979]|uniref:Bacteriophage T5 Orf172 DNA-binding domain-containing protein n=1 Tax=Aulographum hederae CBS 113979 TaxID=1176131 RepID=A0A6G1H6C6_9PEZI|nr:hypothetical protein K402DRAFT_419435 [Aulographum hederae CBS 113979]
MSIETAADNLESLNVHIPQLPGSYPVDEERPTLRRAKSTTDVFNIARYNEADPTRKSTHVDLGHSPPLPSPEYECYSTANRSRTPVVKAVGRLAPGTLSTPTVSQRSSSAPPEPSVSHDPSNRGDGQKRAMRKRLGTPVKEVISSLPRKFEEETITPLQDLDARLRNFSAYLMAKSGYIYVLYSKKLDLVKIGKSGDVHCRTKRISSQCSLPDLEEVFKSHRVPYPIHGEKLAHIELSNFRVKFSCNHLNASHNSGDEQIHREWFRVPKDVAIQTVQRWSAFIEMAFDMDYTKSAKEQSVDALPDIPAASIYEEESLLYRGRHHNDADIPERHHRLRHGRYQQWVEDVFTSNEFRRSV